MLKGVKGALKVLEALDPQSRKNVLNLIAEKDASLAEELIKKMVRKL